MSLSQNNLPGTNTKKGHLFRVVHRYDICIYPDILRDPRNPQKHKENLQTHVQNPEQMTFVWHIILGQCHISINIFEEQIPGT